MGGIIPPPIFEVKITGGPTHRTLAPQIIESMGVAHVYYQRIDTGTWVLEAASNVESIEMTWEE